jgi:retron-type reverse transcriptase
MCGTFLHENREIPSVPAVDGAAGRLGKANGRTPRMHVEGKSDGAVVPVKQQNNFEGSDAEAAEGRAPIRGNTVRQNASRTQSRIDAHSALERVRKAARADKKRRFTALLHHVSVDRLREAYLTSKKHAAAGVDGVTWQQYGERLEDNLRELHARVHRGVYRAKPSRRVYIPKPDGRQRPLGIAALEDKILQRAVVTVMNAIYESDFLGFSYGFRPKRGAHDALDALAVGICGRKVNWVLDADIRGFFDTIDHGWLIKFIEHRVADRRVLRLIQKWLRAGVMQQGRRLKTEVGSPQGATVSPLLANICLHYGAPGQTWCFQRVKFPPRQEVEPPHRESSLGSEEVTNRTKRRQSDARAVTKVKQISLVKYLSAGQQHRSGWQAPVGAPQMARWPETAAGSECTARSKTEASRDLGDPLRSWWALEADRVCRTIWLTPEKGRRCSVKSDSLVVLRARESRAHGEAAKQMKTDFRETSPAPTEAGF